MVWQGVALSIQLLLPGSSSKTVNSDFIYIVIAVNVVAYCATWLPQQSSFFRFSNFRFKMAILPCKCLPKCVVLPLGLGSTKSIFTISMI